MTMLFRLNEHPFAVMNSKRCNSPRERKHSLGPVHSGAIPGKNLNIKLSWTRNLLRITEMATKITLNFTRKLSRSTMGILNRNQPIFLLISMIAKFYAKFVNERFITLLKLCSCHCLPVRLNDNAFSLVWIESVMRLLGCWPLGLWSLHSNVNTTGLCSLMLNTNVPLRTNLELRVFNIIYWKKSWRKAREAKFGA